MPHPRARHRPRVPRGCRALKLLDARHALALAPPRGAALVARPRRPFSRRSRTPASFRSDATNAPRDPDAGGYAWWIEQLENNPEKTWQKVLADFSESPENQHNVAELIANGIPFDPWAG